MGLCKVVEKCETSQLSTIKREANGHFKKGVSANPKGRTPGLRTKATQVKMAFFDAFERTGGVEELVKWLKKTESNKKEFYKMVLSILPKEMKVEGDGVNANIYTIIQQIQQDFSRDSDTSVELDPGDRLHQG